MSGLDFGFTLQTIEARINALTPKQKIVVKDDDEILSNSTTFIFDSELKVALKANQDYSWLLFLWYIATAFAGMKHSMVQPAGVSDGKMQVGEFGSVSVATENATAIKVETGTASDRLVMYQGRLETQATAGDLLVRWAQNVAEVSNTTILHGSTLIVFGEFD